MNKCGEVGLSGKTIGKAHIHTASNSFTQSAVFLKVGWRGNAVQSGVFGGKSARLAEDKKNTQWAQQRGRDLQIAWFVTKKNKHLEALNSAAVHRPTLKRKKKQKANCQWRKREKVKRSELDLFSKCSHILGSTSACPCQRRVGRGGLKRGRERKSTLFFFFPPSFCSQIKS